MSEAMSVEHHQWHGIGQKSDKIWLSSTCRVRLIKKGIEKAGSINQLGREMGYRSRVHPGWSVRQILVGKQPFPLDRLRALADFVGESLEDVLKHQTLPGAITLDNTRRAVNESGLSYYIPH